MSVQQKILKALASLQLTVVLFALSMVLVFWGTLAQAEEPNWVVVEKYFRSGFVMLDMNLLSLFGQKFFELPKDVNFNFKLPFPGGWAIGTVMLLNLLAAHLMRFRLTWKRAGVMVIHSGLVLLMVGELLTGMYAIESRMTMKVGEKSNFLDVHYEPWHTPVELAFIDSSDPKEDNVIVIPSDHLKKVGTTITDDLLPMNVEILEYHKNSELARETNPGPDSAYSLISGTPLKLIPSEEFSDLTEDHAAAPMIKVKLIEKNSGKEIGTHIFSLWQYPNAFSRLFTGQPRTVEVDGKTYRVEFRNKRILKPFTLELLKFDHDRYQGTSIAKNYQSTVRLVDPENGVDREERIAMNEPLRYRGVTMYQSGVLPGDSGTVLQVVKNPGMLIPYIACLVISLGLLIHFIIGLTAFLSRRGSRASMGISHGTAFERFLPWGVILIAATYLGYMSLPGSVEEDSIDYRSIGDLPILDGGRIKPLDSLARASLLMITSKQEWLDSNNKTRTAIEWLVLLLDAPDPYQGPAAEARVFRIEHEDLLKMFDLERRPGKYRYSLTELRPNLRKFRAELAQAEDRAEQVKRKKLTLSYEDELRDGKLLELSKRINVYERLIRGEAFGEPSSNDKRPRLVPPSEKNGDVWRTLIQVDESIQFPTEERERTRNLAQQLVEQRMAEMKVDPNSVTPEEFNHLVNLMLLRNPSPAQRATVSEAAGLLTTVLSAAVSHQQETTHTGRVEQAKRCNEALEKLHKLYDTVPSKKRFSCKLESYLSHSTIFFYTCMLYIFVILLGCASWLTWSTPLRRSAFNLAMFASLVHGFALVARMIISERPPVTNLYGSAIFIGWGCMEICLVLESIFKNGIGAVGGGILGTIATFIAHQLAEGGDTLDVLQAVLDTNFWLSVHVLTVTMGYVATLVLGIIGVIYLIAGIFTPVMDKAMSKTLGMMMYGTCCFAMLLSFFGTTSGGIWGDQSWGRFWGWDPKENGAVLVVIWNALILHARWCGLVKERGLAMLALVGNMVTFWSWFGTNQLGVGLHAYGFNKDLAEMCRWVWVGHFLLICLAMMPQEWWSSYNTLNAATPRPLDTATAASVDSPSIEAVASNGPRETPKPNGHQGGKKKGKQRG